MLIFIYYENMSMNRAHFSEVCIYLRDNLSFWIIIEGNFFLFSATGSLSFNFRTTEPHNLILFNGPKPGHSDFMAVEMHDGILYFVIDLGDGPYRLEIFL